MIPGGKIVNSIYRETLANNFFFKKSSSHTVAVMKMSLLRRGNLMNGSN